MEYSGLAPAERSEGDGAGHVRANYGEVLDPVTAIFASTTGAAEQTTQ